MNIWNGTPVLFVKDALKSRDFYVGILGLTVVMNNGDQNIAFKEGLAVWQISPENVIPQELGIDSITDRNASPRFEIGFETESLDEIHKRLKDNGVAFLHEIHTELWGQRTIRFYDPDNHLIEIGEAMHVFLRRIYDEVGGDWQLASQRTFTPVDALKQILGDL